MYGRMFHAYRCYISIASINSNRRGWSRRIIFCKIPNDSKNFDTFFITPRSFLLFISNLHCLIKQLKNHAIVRKPIFLLFQLNFSKNRQKFRKKRIYVFLYSHCGYIPKFSALQVLWCRRSSRFYPKIAKNDLLFEP